MPTVFIQAYGQEVKIPILIFSAFADTFNLEHMKEFAKTIEAIGIDPKQTLTVGNEEELEAFLGSFAVFFCNRFAPCPNFIREHQDCKFIHSLGVMSWRNMDIINPENKGTLPKDLAEFTGISAFANLRWSKEHGMWVNYGVASMPVQHSIKDLGTRFAKESIKWVAAGRPMRSPGVINALFDNECKQCSDFIMGRSPDTGRCNLCGCHLSKKVTMFNKLAMQTTECPRTPPRWLAMTQVSDDDIKGREAVLMQEFVRIQQASYPNQTGEICNCH